MNLELKDKVVAITGASAGIGKAIALAFAAEGASLAMCARREGPLVEAESAVRAMGVDVLAAQCDIADAKSLDHFLHSAKDHFKRIDILINNASGFGMTDDEAGWSASLSIDVLASVRATKTVVPWMAEAGGGSIQYISSISGLEAGSPPPYAAAKAALISYSKTLAVSLAPKRIRVNTIAPGSIEFPDGFWTNVKANNPGRYKAVLSAIPWGRLGTPEEVADVSVFLASERAGWVTGVCIAVDGAQHKGNL